VVVTVKMPYVLGKGGSQEGIYSHHYKLPVDFTRNRWIANRRDLKVKKNKKKHYAPHSIF